MAVSKPRKCGAAGAADCFHAFVPGMRRLFGYVTPGGLVLRGFDHFLARPLRRIGRVVSSMAAYLLGRCQHGLEKGFQ